MPEHSQPDKEPNEQYEHDMSVFHLAQMLEGYAALYSPDYEERLEDGITVTRGTTELGGELSSTVTFEATRLRSSYEIFPGVPGDVETVEYKITSSVRQEGLTYVFLPENVKEYLEAFEDFLEDEYEDETTVAVEYEQSYSISCDGEFMFENSLSLYVDGEGISLPEHPTELVLETDTVDDEFIDETRVNTDFFASIFNADEMLAMQALSKHIITEHQTEHPIFKFYTHMENQRFLSRQTRVHLAGTIIENMFSSEDIDDAA